MSKPKEHRLPEELMSKLSLFATYEERIECVLDFMQEMLEAREALHFREFWEGRSLCLEFFRASVEPTARIKLWERYSQLCHEAKQLKELFEEESSFITEQIEKALDAVEANFQQFFERGSQEETISALQEAHTLQAHIEQYTVLQNELNQLNVYASRLSSLRKEVMKSDMRYNQRKRLLHRLQSLGDQVFPKRKQDIRQVSELFGEDVNNFVELTLVSIKKIQDLKQAREEIKRLQHISKVLTLSTHTFTQTRLRLSECWDAIKNMLKKQKHEHQDKKEREPVIHQPTENEQLVSLRRILSERQLPEDWYELSHHDEQLSASEQLEFDKMVSDIRDREEKLVRDSGKERIEKLLKNVKEQLEIWRHEQGASDFSLAIARADLVQKEKERLQRLEEFLYE